MKLKRVIAVIVSHVALAVTAAAQSPNVPPLTTTDNTFHLTTLIGGSGFVIPAASTNQIVIAETFETSLGTNNYVTTNSYGIPAGFDFTKNHNLLTASVGDSSNMLVSFSFLGTASSSGELSIFESFDNGNTFAIAPIWQSVAIAPGAAVYGTNFSLSVTAGSTLGFSVGNSGSTIETNVLLEAVSTTPKNIEVKSRQ